MNVLTVELPGDVLARLRTEAVRDGDTVGEWITRAIGDKLRLLLPPADRRPDALQTCRQCGAARPRRRGLCDVCYQRAHPRPRTRRRAVICAACSQLRPIEARGLCSQCYQRQRRTDLRYCRGCRTYAHEFARGLCSACYRRERRAAQKGAA